MAGAQVRATAAALDEGVLDPLRSDQPPRTVIWVAGRGTAETAGAMLAADAGRFGGGADRRRLRGAALDRRARRAGRRGRRSPATPRWCRPPRPVCAVVRGWWSSRPYEGPLRDATAGRSVVAGAAGVGARRLRAGPLPRRRAWPSLHVVDPGLRRRPRRAGRRTRRRGAAQQRRPRPVHQSRQDAGRPHVGTRRGARRRQRRRRWRSPGTARRSCCGSAHQAVAAVGLADPLVALARRDRPASRRRLDETSIFHDEELDGPLPRRVRTFVLDHRRRAARSSGPGQRARRRRRDQRRGRARRSATAAASGRARRAVRSNSWRCWPSDWR